MQVTFVGGRDANVVEDDPTEFGRGRLSLDNHVNSFVQPAHWFPLVAVGHLIAATKTLSQESKLGNGEKSHWRLFNAQSLFHTYRAARTLIVQDWLFLGHGESAFCSRRKSARIPAPQTQPCIQ